MSKNSDVFKEIRGKTDCRALLKRFFPDHFREQGNSLCPFHDDKTPSLQVEKDHVYCHSAGCTTQGKRIDAVDLYTHGAKCTRKEAIRDLKRELGIKGGTPDFEERWHKLLKNPIPTEAKTYLEETRALPGITEALKERSLVAYDSYAKSVVFPVSDWHGNIQGLQRIPLNGAKKKFVTGTKAKTGFFRFGTGDAVITEAVIDALSVYLAHDKEVEVISTLSASTTGKLDKVGGKLNGLPILFFDNDESGRKATEKALNSFDGQARVVDWNLAPDGCKDANDLLKKGHQAVIKAMIQGAAQPEDWEPSEDEPEASKEERETQTQALVRLMSEAETFKTQDDLVYVSFPVNDHRETWPLWSSKFDTWLSYSFYKDTGNAIEAQSVQKVLKIITGETLYNNAVKPIFLRTARKEREKAIYVDLVNPQWEVVKITPQGWEIITNPDVKFRRTRGMKPLPKPQRGGTLEALKPFLNVPDENAWRMMVAWLVHALNPYGPYPILNIEGEQGSAKSTTLRLLRSLVDPSFSPIRALPRNERDLMIAANNGWVMAYDNLSGVPLWVSDALCRVATGGGFSTRTLMTNEDETIFDATRPLMLNGIDRIASKHHDLADRSIVLNLKHIPEEKRVRAQEIEAAFNAAAPRILGALYDAVSEALKNEDDIRISGYPRMADFLHWVVSAESALPWNEGDFMKTYQENMAEAVEQSIENDLVASAIIMFMEDRTLWTGTATELLQSLNEITCEEVKKLRKWPKTPISLGSKLKRGKGSLRKFGIIYQKERSEDTKRTRKIILEYSNNLSNLSNLSRETANPDGINVCNSDKLTENRKNPSSNLSSRTSLDKFGQVEQKTYSSHKYPEKEGFQESSDKLDKLDKHSLNQMEKQESNYIADCGKCPHYDLVNDVHFCLFGADSLNIFFLDACPIGKWIV